MNNLEFPQVLLPLMVDAFDILIYQLYSFIGKPKFGYIGYAVAKWCRLSMLIKLPALIFTRNYITKMVDVPGIFFHGDDRLPKNMYSN